MIALGLTAADMALYVRSLSTHHSVKITVQIVSLNHAYLADLSSMLIDGQVTIDGDAEVTRSLTLQLLDPDHVLQIDSDSPGDGALYYDRMIRVVYSVKSELLPRWVDVPIFCGPITKMTRTSDIINVECQGKESLVLPPTAAWYARTFAKGLSRTAIIKTLLGTYGGETKFSVPAYSDRTAGAVTLHQDSNIWAICKALNGSYSTRHMFYDGRGVLVIRSTPKTPTFTFRTGVSGNVTTAPTVDYDISNVRNVVKVIGAIPKGKKAPVIAAASLPASHSLNATRMGRNGKPRVLLEVITDDNMKTTSQAKKLANDRVKALSLQAVSVAFEGLVAPHLEPYDVYTLKTDDFAVTARYVQAVIPLRQSVGSVGYLMNKSINRTRIRRR